ncbi:MFS transporter [Luminiphilus sp.]|nr:MFS transporter [Luminiphilus sp.]
MNTNSVTIDQPLPLIATVIVGAVAIIIFNALPVIMGVASDSLGLTATQMGLLASLELAGIGLTSVSGLFWIRKVPWRRAVLIGMLVLAAGNVLSIFVDGANTLIVVRFFTGLLGEGVVFTVGIAAIGDSRNADRAFAYSIVGQVGLGMIALWSFPYVAASLGFPGVMGVMAVLALLTLVLLPWLPAGGEKIETSDKAGQSDVAAGGITTPLIGLFGIVIWFVGLSGIWAFVERIGSEIPLEQTTIGMLLSLGLGLGALASLLVALVGDRYGRFWPPLAALVLHAIICFFFAGKLTVVVYGALVLLLTFIWNIGLPYLLGLIADSDASGRLVVLIVSAQAFGNTIGPLVAGQVVESRGLATVGVSSALFSIMAFGVIAIFIYRIKTSIVLKPATGNASL